MPDADDPVLAPGTMVGAYRIVHPLGQGGMGAVYAAEEPIIGKRAAIKVLRRALADDPSIAARFEREARAVNEISHPGIVDVFAFGKLADGRPYLVMSLLEGRSLREELDRRPRKRPSEAWRLARRVAEALLAAHKAGIIHRDLKPDNVFLEEREGEAVRPRLLDFGLAKVDEAFLGADLAKLTQSGTPMGTPAYMAPEQWWCKPADGRTDQYALAVVLYEMLAGKPPFASQQYVELLQQHLHESPPTLAEAGISAPPAVEELLQKALAKEMSSRFSSMDELIEAGDRAFGAWDDEAVESECVGAAPTEVAIPRAVMAATPLEPRGTSQVVTAARPPPSYRRHAAAHGLLLSTAIAAAIAMGYAGEFRHHPWGIVLIAGWGPLFTLAWFGLAAILFPWLARRRARTGRTTTVGWWFAIVTMVSGALSTYAGWQVVNAAVHDLPLELRFAIWNTGLYEANAGRFIGLAFAVPLLLSIAAMAGVTDAAVLTRSRVKAAGAKRGELLLGTGALLTATLASLVLDAPSAAYIAFIAALGVATGTVLPTLHPDTAARDELERTVASTLAVATAVAAGFARIEAREATAWFEDVPRSARVLEIVEATRERQTTTIIALIAMAVVVSLAFVRIRRLRAVGQPVHPTPSAWMMIAVIGAIAVGDILLHRDFFETRQTMREQIEQQFSSFARLTPPLGEQWSGPEFGPHAIPNLQVAPNLVALGGRGLAPLAALDSTDGAMNVGRDLMHALGESSRARAEQSRTETVPQLALTIDRSVSYEYVQKILLIARKSGVTSAEIRLTREPAPELDKGAPPEARYMLPRDFVALPVTLADRGASPDPSLTFEQAIADLSPTHAQPMVLAAPLPPSP